MEDILLKLANERELLDRIVFDFYKAGVPISYTRGVEGETVPERYRHYHKSNGVERLECILRLLAEHDKLKDVEIRPA